MFDCCLQPSKLRSRKQSKSSLLTTDYEYYNESNNSYTQREDDEDEYNAPAFATPTLRENIMRQRYDRNPFDVYKAVKLIGTGSMGTVSLVKKRDEVIGGSARWHNLSLRSQLEIEGVHPGLITFCTIPIIGKYFQSLVGFNKEQLDITRHHSSSAFSMTVSQHTASNSFHGVSTSFSGSLRSKRLYTQNSMSTSESPTHHHDNKNSSSEPAYIVINKYLENHKDQGKKTEVLYALKSIRYDFVKDPTYVAELKNEIETLKRLDHAHIVRPLETYEYRDHLYMVLELCSGGDLYSRDPYFEDQAARIVSSILSAVSYMHECGIVHRDLKYENVMFVNMSPNAEIKIIDFGLSKKFLPNEKFKKGVGTIYTMAPEVFSGSYSEKADVWSTGVIAFMLLSSQMPFYGKSRKEIYESIRKCQYSFRGRRWASVSMQAKSFVSDLLTPNPEERITAEEAKQSLWLNKRFNTTTRGPSYTDLEAMQVTIFNYSSYKTLQKIALMVIAHHSTSEEISGLRKIFQYYDTGNDGVITKAEFQQISSEFDYSEEMIESLFTSLDVDKTGKIKYTEFLAAMLDSTGLVDEDHLAEAFDRIDSDDTGYISFQNLRDILGEDVPDEYINQVLAEADFKKNNRVTYDEFLAMWNVEEENNMRQFSCISSTRTVRMVAQEMLFSDVSDNEKSDPSATKPFRSPQR